MNIRDKTPMIINDDIPLVRAALVTSEAEVVRHVPTEYVIVDDVYFLESPNASEVQSVSSTSLGSSTSTEQDEASETPRAFHYSYPDLIPPQHQNSFTQGESFVQNSNIDPSKTCGAWAAGIVLGFLMGVSPSLSMAFGIGAAFCSQQEEGIAGDVARAMGDVAILSHKKFMQVNHKHNIVNGITKNTIQLSKQSMTLIRRTIVDFFFATEQNNIGSTSRQTSGDGSVTT